MQFTKLLKKAAVVAAIASAGPAMAVPISVIFNVAALGAFTSDTGDVTTMTTVSAGSPTLVGAIVANNVGLVGGQSVTLSPDPLGVTVGSVFTKTFTTALGTFVETLTVTNSTSTTNSRSVLAIGTITQTVGTGFDAVSVYWSASYTQNAGPGGQINGSFNNSTVPPSVPEPGSLALAGLALAGLGLSARRRNAK